MKTSRQIPGHELKLTSIKYHPYVYDRFQQNSFKLITLQSLINRSMDLFSTDTEFRNKVLAHTRLLPSGSL